MALAGTVVFLCPGSDWEEKAKDGKRGKRGEGKKEKKVGRKLLLSISPRTVP
jgi:hypothetical protein